jgi:hypothetical protein
VSVVLKTADPYAPPTPLFADPLAKRMLSLAHGRLICHSQGTKKQNKRKPTEGKKLVFY